MVFSILSLFKAKQEDRYIAGDSEKPTVILVDLDPETERLLAVFQDLNHPIVILSISGLFQIAKVYDSGDRVTRGKLSERLLAYSGLRSILFVSSDINSRLREIVDVANTIRLKTSLLSFESLNNGDESYKNSREGYDYPIADKAYFIDEQLMQEVQARNKGPSDIVYVGEEVVPALKQDEYNNILLGGYSRCCLIEDVPAGYINWIIRYSTENKIKIFARQDILKKSERDKLSEFCTFVPSGERYRIILNSAYIIYRRGGGVEVNGKVIEYSTLPEALYPLYLPVDNDREVNSGGLSTLKTSSLSSEVSKPYKKIKYKTLVLNLKRGDNLFGSLNWYPKLLGCDNHVIYRGGNVDGEVYASFGLPDVKIQEKIKNLAKNNNSPYYNIENGFLAFSGIALLDSAKSHSMLLDSKSMYFDGVGGSSIEDDILFSDDLSLKDERRAKSLIERISINNLSKYNHAPQMLPLLPGHNEHKVLIIDQRYADKSIGYAGASEETFNTMLMDAYNENPNSDIIIKVHPDALTGLVKGHFDKSAENMPRVYLYAEDINPICLLKSIHSVYVVSSQMGFEALMLDKPVHVYGKAIYAGWGLTIDRVQLERRGKEKRTLQQLFKVLYIDNVPYVDPLTGAKVSIENYLDVLMKVRGAGNARSNLINIGDGQIIHNNIVDQYYIEKDGAITFNTVMASLYSLNPAYSLKRVLCRLGDGNQLPSSSELLDIMINLFQEKIDKEYFEHKLLNHNKQNDVFNLLRVFHGELDQDTIIRVSQNACYKSNSANFIKKYLYWTVGVLAKSGVTQESLLELLLVSNEIDSDEIINLEKFTRAVSGKAC